jgi:hypothetical protein
LFTKQVAPPNQQGHCIHYSLFFTELYTCLVIPCFIVPSSKRGTLYSPGCGRRPDTCGQRRGGDICDPGDAWILQVWIQYPWIQPFQQYCTYVLQKYCSFGANACNTAIQVPCNTARFFDAAAAGGAGRWQATDRCEYLQYSWFGASRSTTSFPT